MPYFQYRIIRYLQLLLQRLAALSCLYRHSYKCYIFILCIPMALTGIKSQLSYSSWYNYLRPAPWITRCLETNKLVHLLAQSLGQTVCVSPVCICTADEKQRQLHDGYWSNSISWPCKTLLHSIRSPSWFRSFKIICSLVRAKLMKDKNVTITKYYKW